MNSDLGYKNIEEHSCLVALEDHSVFDEVVVPRRGGKSVLRDLGQLIGTGISASSVGDGEACTSGEALCGVE